MNMDGPTLEALSKIHGEAARGAFIAAWERRNGLDPNYDYGTSLERQPITTTSSAAPRANRDPLLQAPSDSLTIATIFLMSMPADPSDRSGVVLDRRTMVIDLRAGRLKGSPPPDASKLVREHADDSWLIARADLQRYVYETHRSGLARSSPLSAWISHA